MLIKRQKRCICTLSPVCVCALYVSFHGVTLAILMATVLLDSVPFFMQLFYGNNNSQESVIRSSNRPANENSYCEDDSFIRDKLNSSR